MGSRCELKIYSTSKSKSQKVRDLVIAEVSRFEEKYTRYKPTSVTSLINAEAGTNRPVKVDFETARLLDYAGSLYQQSDGLFDITSGVLRQAWDFRSYQLPTDEELGPILDVIGWSKITWENDYVYLPIKGMEIDFGGFVKEYTADVIATICIENDIKHGFINLGGDLRVIGPHPDGSPWRVGIQHPREKEKPIVVVDIKYGAVATSGDYERYMIVDNVRYSHLLNPKTGWSIKPTYASVSIVAESCLLAGSFTTIAMLKSEKDPLWLSDVDLPYLKVDQLMKLSGTMKI